MSDIVDAISYHLAKTGKVIVKGEFGASASTTYVFDHIDSRNWELNI
jgi:hypothetical protein